MKIHLFNPEHDIALAAGNNHFTAPHAAASLRADLGFLPAFWGKKGDWVVADDLKAVEKASRHVRQLMHNVKFITMADLRNLPFDGSEVQVEPWGWDADVCRRLLDADARLAPFLPSTEQLERIRSMSNRRFAAEVLLPQLLAQPDGLTGCSRYLQDAEQAWQATREAECVLKAPWSSSGRGLRYVLHDAAHPEESYRTHLQGWLRNVVQRQGGVMLEPLYKKVKDLGAEFSVQKEGTIVYEGLSLFKTVNGAYAGNVLATEQEKRQVLARFVDLAFFDSVIARIITLLSPWLSGWYVGPFGVDMMVVPDEANNRFLLHPCVELNLRRTMGHVALAVSPHQRAPYRVMSFSYNGSHRISIRKTEKI